MVSGSVRDGGILCANCGVRARIIGIAVRYEANRVNHMAVLPGAVIVLLLMFNGFLAMSEIAIVSSRRSRLEQLADAGRVNARTALALAENPSRYLAAIQMGMTLIGILAGTSVVPH